MTYDTETQRTRDTGDLNGSVETVSEYNIKRRNHDYDGCNKNAVYIQ